MSADLLAHFPKGAEPRPEQVRLLREEIDPDGLCKREAGVR